MKRCPKCNREFEDDLRFCLDDGTSLVAVGISPTVAAPTAVLPTPDVPLPTLTVPARADVPTLGEQPATTLAATGKGSTAGISPVAIVIGIVLGFAAILCLAGFTLWGLFYARRVPMVLLCLAGMVFAMLRAKGHPKPALLAGLGLGWYILNSFVFTAINYNVVRMASVLSIHYQALFVGLSLVDYIGYSIVIVLLVAAVFAGRGSRLALNK